MDCMRWKQTQRGACCFIHFLNVIRMLGPENTGPFHRSNGKQLPRATWRNEGNVKHRDWDEGKEGVRKRREESHVLYSNGKFMYRVRGAGFKCRILMALFYHPCKDKPHPDTFTHTLMCVNKSGTLPTYVSEVVRVTRTQHLKYVMCHFKSCRFLSDSIILWHCRAGCRSTAHKHILLRLAFIILFIVSFHHFCLTLLWLCTQ